MQTVSSLKRSKGISLTPTNIFIISVIAVLYCPFFNMMFMDTSVIGDKEYFAAKMTAMGDYLKRRRADDIDKEADDAVLEDVKADFELKENHETMSELEKKIEEGGES